MWKEVRQELSSFNFRDIVECWWTYTEDVDCKVVGQLSITCGKSDQNATTTDAMGLRADGVWTTRNKRPIIII